MPWATWRHDNRRSGYHGYELEVGVPEGGTWEVTAGVKLEQNTPNPFNPATTIAYTIPEDGREIRLALYDVAGRLVTTLVDGSLTGGTRSVVWNGTDTEGRQVASGVYFVRLTARDTSLVRKIVLLK